MLKYSNTRTVDLNDWNRLVEETYGRPYHLQQQDGCKPRGTEYVTVPMTEEEVAESEEFMHDFVPEEVNGKIMGVKFQTWLDRDPNLNGFGEGGEWKNELFWERNFYPSLEAVANDLYKKGLIEAGEYAIDIDW